MRLWDALIELDRVYRAGGTRSRSISADSGALVASSSPEKSRSSRLSISLPVSGSAITVSLTELTPSGEDASVLVILSRVVPCNATTSLPHRLVVGRTCRRCVLLLRDKRMSTSPADQAFAPIS